MAVTRQQNLEDASAISGISLVQTCTCRLIVASPLALCCLSPPATMAKKDKDKAAGSSSAKASASSKTTDSKKGKGKDNADDSATGKVPLVSPDATMLR